MKFLLTVLVETSSYNAANWLADDIEDMVEGVIAVTDIKETDG